MLKNACLQICPKGLSSAEQGIVHEHASLLGGGSDVGKHEASGLITAISPYAGGHDET
ncbi:MAG: hypothetical protein WA957_16995 [Alteraurantiacibacter sp.]